MLSTFAPTFSNEDVLSLLRFPITSDSSADKCHQQMSFEVPFDNPDLEPVPFGPCESREDSSASEPSPFDQVSSSDLIPSSKPDASFLKDVKERSTPKTTDYSQSLFSILFEQKDGIIGTKRTSSDLLSELSTTLGTKRQRTSQDASSQETVMRFRPYQDHQWRGMYQKLVKYKLKHGHCCVPHSYKEDPMLARWVKRQRYQYKKFEDKDPTSTMTAHRIEQLDSIGFVWHSHASAWQTKLNELKAFKHQAGHCNVPSNHPDNPSLSAWTRCQRRQYRLWRSGCSSTMTAERYELLQALGFSFDTLKPGSKR